MDLVDINLHPTLPPWSTTRLAYVPWVLCAAFSWHRHLLARVARPFKHMQVRRRSQKCGSTCLAFDNDGVKSKDAVHTSSATCGLGFATRIWDAPEKITNSSADSQRPASAAACRSRGLDHSRPGKHFCVANRLGFADHHVDLALQILRHLAVAIGKLRELRSATKPGLALAIIEAPTLSGPRQTYEAAKAQNLPPAGCAGSAKARFWPAVADMGFCRLMDGKARMSRLEPCGHD